MFKNIENFGAIKNTLDDKGKVDKIILNKLRSLKLRNLGDVSMQHKAVKCKILLFLID